MEKLKADIAELEKLKSQYNDPDGRKAFIALSNDIMQDIILRDDTIKALRQIAAEDSTDSLAVRMIQDEFESLKSKFIKILKEVHGNGKR